MRRDNRHLLTIYIITLPENVSRLKTSGAKGMNNTLILNSNKIFSLPPGFIVDLRSNANVTKATSRPSLSSRLPCNCQDFEKSGAGVMSISCQKTPANADANSRACRFNSRRRNKTEACCSGRRLCYRLLRGARMIADVTSRTKRQPVGANAHGNHPHRKRNKKYVSFTLSNLPCKPANDASRSGRRSLVNVGFPHTPLIQPIVNGIEALSVFTPPATITPDRIGSLNVGLPLNITARS